MFPSIIQPIWIASVVTRHGAPTLVPRVLPEWIAVLFAISQLSAIIDLGRLLRELHGQPISVRMGIGIAVVGTFAVPCAKRVRATLYTPRFFFLWPLPLTDTTIALSAFPIALIASLPAAVLASLFSPLAAIAVWVLTAASGLVLTSTRWIRSAPLLGLFAVLAAMATVWPLLSLLVAPLAMPSIGRVLYSGRPLESGSIQSRFRARGPVTALLWHNAVTVQRAAGLRVWLGLSMLLVVSTAIQGALTRTWEPDQVAAGARITLGFSGWIPFAVLATCCQRLGTRWMAPDFPVSDRAHMLVATGLASTPLWAMVGMQASTGIGGISGLALAAVHATTLGTLAAARSTGPDAANAVGLGVAVSVFSTLASVAWPAPTCMAEIILIGGALGLGQRRLEQRRTTA